MTVAISQDHRQKKKEINKIPQPKLAFHLMTNSLANWFLISYRQSRLLGVLVLVINNIYAISQSPNFPGKQLWRGAWLEDRGHLLLAPLLCYLFNTEKQPSFSFEDVNADWLTIHAMWPSVWCPNPSERRRMDERVGWREGKVERDDVIKRREKKDWGLHFEFVTFHI